LGLPILIVVSRITFWSENETKSMNDLSKKTEEEISKAIPSGKVEHPSEEQLLKKLDAYLLLIYQAYLKKETQLEPETKTALLNSVKQDEDFALKVRMMQLDYLNFENIELEGEWNEAKEVLFPIIDATLSSLDEHRRKTIAGYKEIISDLLKSSSEFSS